MTNVKFSKLTSTLLCMALLAPAASYAEKGDFIVRGRVIGVLPQDDSGIISAGGGTIPIASSGVTVEDSATPELDITYMVTNNIGIELIAGVTNHEVNLSGTGVAAATGIPALRSGLELFDTWVLPPTVTAQWHFMPESNIRPYVGLGVNYTHFLFDDASDQLEAILGPVEVNTEQSWGWAAQAGVDVDLNDRWFVNFDVKYIDINTTAKLKTGTAFGTLQVDVDIDPVVVGLGIGMRF